MSLFNRILNRAFAFADEMLIKLSIKLFLFEIPLTVIEVAPVILVDEINAKLSAGDAGTAHFNPVAVELSATSVSPFAPTARRATAVSNVAMSPFVVKAEGPVTPVNPVAPVGPVTLAPVAPVGPVTVEPVFPVGPVGPVAPGSTERTTFH